MTNKLNAEQAVALERARNTVERWRTETRRIVDGRQHALASIRRAVDLGVPQAEIARACGWPRQRVHQLLKEEER